jgi:hypothetical protein
VELRKKKPKLLTKLLESLDLKNVKTQESGVNSSKEYQVVKEKGPLLEWS